MATRKTHCWKGHPLEGDNLGGSDGRRFCKTCANARARVTAPHQGFRKVALTSVIEIDPKGAAATIVQAYKKAGASMRAAAALLGVTERTVHRWVDKLDLRPRLHKVAERIANA